METQKSSKAIMNIINWGLPLPPHIAPFIFSKLSISNLPLCRSVCKSWNLLVLDYAQYSFSKLQLPNSIIFATCDFSPNFLNPKIQCFDIDTLSIVASHTPVEPDVKLIHIYNCCNGLLYICKHGVGDGDGDDICKGIFNPMTGEFFQTPNFYDLPHPLYTGFGLSTKTNQYKIFLAYINESTCELKILRLGSNHKHNQWTSMYLPFPINIRSPGIYMNGEIYWIGMEKNNRNVRNIYALDVEAETFEVMVLEVGSYSYQGTLQLFNGTIYAIIYMTKPINQIQFWKMQSKDSWIKDFIVPVSDNYKNLDVRPFKAFEDGKILVRIRNSLFWLKYGRKIEEKDKIRTLIPLERQFTYFYFCHIDSLHFGSLPSILAGNDQSF